MYEPDRTDSAPGSKSRTRSGSGDGAGWATLPVVAKIARRTPTAASATPIQRSQGRIFLSVLAANLLLGAGLFVLGVALFLAFTLPMDNDFATWTREHAPGLAIRANVRTLPGYLLLAVAFTLLGYPLARKRAAFRDGRRLRGLGLVALVNAGLFVLSLGLAAVGHPGVLDALARHAAAAAPSIDLYALRTLHVPEVLAGALAVVVLRAAFVYAGMLPRRWRMAAAGLGLAAAATAGIAASLGPGRAAARPPGAPPNVLVIASDSLRADRLSCYGHPRKTSPAIDALAAEGVLFENLHVATASTLESWATILTSRWPSGHGLRYMFASREQVDRVSADPDTLPRVLARAGYHTAVSSNWAGNCFRLADFGFEANHASDVQNLDVFLAEAALLAHWVWPLYFNNRLGEALFPEIRQTTSYLDPGALLDRLDGEIDRAAAARRPFFGVLFTSTTHLPYAASWPFSTRWSDPAYRGRNRYQIDFEVDDFIQDGFSRSLSDAEIRHIRDLYDGTVSEFDATVAEVVDRLRARGLLESTILVVTSDHGDDLYEPGTTLGHGTNFFGGDQATRIPFVVRFPDRRHAGARVPALARTLDIAPTILDLLALPRPGSWAGVSFAPALDDPAADPGVCAFAETCYLFFPKKGHPADALTVKPADKTLFIDPGFRNNFVLKPEYHQRVIEAKDRMIRTPRWKLIHIPGRQGPIHRLYDMKADPGQTRDLSAENLAVMPRLVEALDTWWKEGRDVRWSRADDGR